MGWNSVIHISPGNGQNWFLQIFEAADVFLTFPLIKFFKNCNEIIGVIFFKTKRTQDKKLGE